MTIEKHGVVQTDMEKKAHAAAEAQAKQLSRPEKGEVRERKQPVREEKK